MSSEYRSGQDNVSIAIEDIGLLGAGELDARGSAHMSEDAIDAFSRSSFASLSL